VGESFGLCNGVIFSTAEFYFVNKNKGQRSIKTRGILKP